MKLIGTAKFAALLALLAGCSSMPERRPIEANLSEEIVYQESNGGAYFKISSVQADAAAGQVISEGRLWLAYKTSDQLKFIRLSEVKSIWANSSSNGGSTRIETKSGEAFGSNFRMISLCPQDTVPVAQYSCPQARKFFGSKVTKALPEGAGNKDVREVEKIYSYYSGDVYIPRILTVAELKDQFAKEAERDRLNAERVAVNAKAEAERLASWARHRAIEREQRAQQTMLKLQGFARGTKVYCVSSRVIPRDAAVAPDTEFNCPQIGSVTLGELDGAGWNTAVVGRRTGQQFDSVGDFIDLSATKPR
jgi:hypothetical protein